MSFRLPNGRNAACRISSFTFSARPPTYSVVFGLEPLPPVATSVVVAILFAVVASCVLRVLRRCCVLLVFSGVAVVVFWGHRELSWVLNRQGQRDNTPGVCLLMGGLEERGHRVWQGRLRADAGDSSSRACC